MERRLLHHPASGFSAGLVLPHKKKVFFSSTCVCARKCACVLCLRSFTPRVTFLILGKNSGIILGHSLKLHACIDVVVCDYAVCGYVACVVLMC